MDNSEPRVSQRTLVKLSRTQNKTKIIKHERWQHVPTCLFVVTTLITYIETELEGTLDSMKPS